MTDLETGLPQRLFWWKTPAEAYGGPGSAIRAQVMTYGNVEDLAATLRHFPR